MGNEEEMYVDGADDEEEKKAKRRKAKGKGWQTSTDVEQEMMMDVDTDVLMPAKKGKRKEVKGQLVRKLTPADDMRIQPGKRPALVFCRWAGSVMPPQGQSA